MLSEARRWVLAPSAILVRRNLDDPGLLGGLPPSAEAEAESREILEEDWKVASAAALKSALTSLLGSTASEPSEIAWNLGRVSFVAGRGYLAGFLDEAAAWDACFTAARRLQTAFASWEAFGEAYVKGRQDWAGEADPATHYVFRALVLETAGTWSVPWSTSL